MSILSVERWLCIQKLVGLTPRELQIARLVCDGLSWDEIAERLGNHPQTAKQLWRITARTIRSRNKVHAVALLLKAGMAADVSEEKF